jgi:regulator of protease activity HflC (stomatin/prohibitin superfamily)
MTYLITGAVVAAVLAIIARAETGVTTVYEHEHGLRFVRGRLRDELGAGRYRYLKAYTTVRTIDTRPVQLAKKIFAQVVKARQEGLAALERARGETAALRNLANAAQMVERNPHLFQLRLLQVAGQQTGTTLVVGMPQGTSALPLRQAATDVEALPPREGQNDVGAS